MVGVSTVTSSLQEWPHMTGTVWSAFHSYSISLPLPKGTYLHFLKTEWVCYSSLPSEYTGKQVAGPSTPELSPLAKGICVLSFPCQLALKHGWTVACL